MSHDELRELLWVARNELQEQANYLNRYGCETRDAAVVLDALSSVVNKLIKSVDEQSE